MSEKRIERFYFILKTIYSEKRERENGERVPE